VLVRVRLPVVKPLAIESTVPETSIARPLVELRTRLPRLSTLALTPVLSLTALIAETNFPSLSFALISVTLIVIPLRSKLADAAEATAPVPTAVTLKLAFTPSKSLFLLMISANAPTPSSAPLPITTDSRVFT